MTRTIADFRDRAPRMMAGLVRRLRVTLARSSMLWQLRGYTDPEGNEEPLEDVPCFQGVGFAARPKAGDEVEAITVGVGGKASHPVIVATRNRSTKFATEPDEAAIFTSLRAVLVNSLGQVRLGKDASESIIKGNAFASALSTMHSTIATAAATLATAGATWGAVNPPTAAANLTYATAVSAFVTAMTGAQSTFQSAVTSALSSVAKTE